MNRFLIASLAAGGAFLLTSCSSDEPLLGPDGNGGKVTFIAEIPAETLTRDFGDGTQAKKLSYAVYEVDAEGNASATPVFATGLADSPEPVALADNKGFSLEVTLIKGQTYNVVFWADAATGSPYTFSAADHNISVSYEGAVANDESRDAFFQSIKNYTADNSATVPVTLKRPFAQVNFGTADLASLPGKVTVNNVSLKVTNAYDRLDLLSGVASAASGEPAEVTFAAAPLPTQAFPEIEGSDKTYNYLEMNYILTGTDIIDNDVQQAQGELVECTVTAGLSSGRNAVFNINNVPVQRNYRTNIYGNLLTSKTDYQISVDASFENDIVVDADLKALADKGGEFVLTKDIHGGYPGNVLQAHAAPLTVTAKNAVLDLNGHNMDGAYIAVEGTLTVKNTGSVKAPYFVERGPFENAADVASDGLPMFVVKKGGKLNFENANITATVSNGQEVIKVEDGGSLNILNSTIASPRHGTHNEVLSVDEGSSKVVIENSHLSSTATVFMTNYKGSDSYNIPTITIKGSSFSPYEYGTPMPTVVIDIPCRLNVTGSTFEGSMNALTIRQGTAILKDCTLISNLQGMSENDIDSYEGIWSTGPWENLVVRQQAALIVGNYVEPDMSYFPDTNFSDPVSVTLSGTTTLKSNNPTKRNALVVRAKDSDSSAVTLTVNSTCTITGLVKFLGGKINATGISATE